MVGKKKRSLITLIAVCSFSVVWLNFSYLNNLRNDDTTTPNVSGAEPPQQLGGLKQQALSKPKKGHHQVLSEKKIKEEEIKNDQSEQKVVTNENIAVHPHKVAGLSCAKYGGPSDEAAAEMVYWRDIPSDAHYTSPFADTSTPKYLTFEPDEGGWNNIRMSMETATVMAHAMGRILVMPPTQGIYLLSGDNREGKNKFTFKDFYHFDSIAVEHSAIEVISFEEFLKREGITGNLRDKDTGQVSFPPGNRTNWDGSGRSRGFPLWPWMRQVANNPIWFFDKCTSAFASKKGGEGVERVKKYFEEAMGDSTHANARMHGYNGKPTPVDAPPAMRLREMMGHRKEICIYDEEKQNAKVIHLMGDNASGARLLVHFYAFLFFEDYHQDLWTKRFVRDHLRYVDEIQCAAAKIVEAVRAKARVNGDPNGVYDSFHIRRGDFQYKHTRISAEQIYENVKDVLVENSTIFIATDERDKPFFDPLRAHYKLLFLDDFLHLVPDINKNFYGMLDQLIASRGRSFIGAYFSTFTGFINRMRGYHALKDKAPGSQEGSLNSYFYVPIEEKLSMKEYRSIRPPMWSREFPVGWRDIDHDLDDGSIVSR